MLKRLTLATLALVLTAETPPPATLTPYIKDGRFIPGDYGWLRGSFADATPAQKDEWRDLWAWRERCRAEQFALISAELAKRGITMSETNRGNGTVYAAASPMLCRTATGAIAGPRSRQRRSARGRSRRHSCGAPRWRKGLPVPTRQT